MHPVDRVPAGGDPNVAGGVHRETAAGITHDGPSDLVEAAAARNTEDPSASRDRPYGAFGIGRGRIHLIDLEGRVQCGGSHRAVRIGEQSDIGADPQDTVTVLQERDGL
jgi:hypothetical protein